MSRLIIVPQYPSKLRYQEWWYTELPKQYGYYFDDVIVLGSIVSLVKAEGSNFSPINEAIEFETEQIKEYLNLELFDDDILLLCDLSFPGLFSHVLYHKRPRHCFAICHATSKNNYDYFTKDRSSKWGVETGIAKLFDMIFVGTEYHKQKLGWNNIFVSGLPLLSFSFAVQNIGKYRDVKSKSIVSVARAGIQKRNRMLENKIEKYFNTEIEEIHASSWNDYYTKLSQYRILLITSKEETFGYQVHDGVVNGCYVVAPKKYSYPELIPSEYLYSNFLDLVRIIEKIYSGKQEPPVKTVLNREECLNFYEKTSEIMKGIET